MKNRLKLTLVAISFCIGLIGVWGGAIGAVSGQLLFAVQKSLAPPTIPAGIRQTTMMALSMNGAGGLGYQVLQGIQRLRIGSGLMAGFGIVILATNQTIKSAYGSLASNNALITVRHANSDIAGVFTPKRVFDAQARA